jgi:hypothetical protein
LALAQTAREEEIIHHGAKSLAGKMTDMTERKEDRCTHKARGEGKMKTA